MKYKKGDEVLIVSDLTMKFTVRKVWVEKQQGIFETYKFEYAVLDNNTVYGAHELTFYSKPIMFLARKIQDLEQTKKDIPKIKK